MSHFGKLIIAALLACVVLATATSAASALRSFSVNESRYRLITESLVTVIEPFTIVCAATITHTITRTIAKREGTLAGHFTEFVVAGCRTTEGTAVTMRFLGLREGWPFFYRSFAGTLPNIVRISYRLERIQLLAEVGTVYRCLYQGNGTYFWGFEGQPDEDNDTLNLFADLRGLFACPRTANVSAIVSIEPPLEVRLI